MIEVVVAFRALGKAGSRVELGEHFKVQLLGNRKVFHVNAVGIVHGGDVPSWCSEAVEGHLGVEISEISKGRGWPGKIFRRHRRDGCSDSAEKNGY